MFIEQCRRAPLGNAGYTDVTSRYSLSTTTVTSSSVDYNAVDDDDDDRRVLIDDLEQSGSGDIASRDSPRGRFSDATATHSDTRRLRPAVSRPTPTPILLSRPIQRFRQAGDVIVAMTTRSTAAESSSTSFTHHRRLSMTSLITLFLLVQLTITKLRT